MDRSIIKSAVLAVVSASLSLSIAAHAQQNKKQPIPPMEKCYGVAKAGKNDCGSSGSNACQAQSKVNGDPNAWIFVPKGTCDKIVGGSTTPKTTGGTGQPK